MSIRTTSAIGSMPPPPPPPLDPLLGVGVGGVGVVGVVGVIGVGVPVFSAAARVTAAPAST